MSKSRKGRRRRYILKCLVVIFVVPLAATLFVAERKYVMQSIELPREEYRSLRRADAPILISRGSKIPNKDSEEESTNQAAGNMEKRRESGGKDGQDRPSDATGVAMVRRNKNGEDMMKDEKGEKERPLYGKDKGSTGLEVAKAALPVADDRKRNHEREKKKKADTKKRQKQKQEAEKNQEIFEAVRRAVEDALSKGTGNGTVPNCLDPSGPQPIILMSLGRSGSGSTWQVLGNLTGMETPSVEYTGSSREESLVFFEKVGADEGGWWLMKYMCYMQRKFPKAGVVGFKWKPNRAVTTPGATNGLKLLSELKNPSIKVVRSRRNLLDVIISRYKHKNHQGRVPAHCRVGDEDCVKMQLQAGTGVALPTNKLLSLLKTLSKEEDEVDERLEELGVPHVDASFDELYYGKDADEWSKIFRFLGVGPRSLTMETVNGKMAHQATSHPSHKKAIQNFDEVKSLLSGTKFEELLHW